MVSASVQEIVHAFLQTYYQRMKTNPSKLSNLYSSTAELTHINYNQISPSTNNKNCSDIIPTIKLTGKDNINKFFTRHESKVNKLKVKLDTCDFQTMGVSHRNVLIVVTGELFWDGTPVHQFCQTFILIPVGKSSDIYDISNDIIRFIPDTFKTVQLSNGNENVITKKEDVEIRHTTTEKDENNVGEEESKQLVSDSGTDEVVVNGKENVEKTSSKSEKSSKKSEHHHHHHTKSVDSVATKASKKIESDQEVESEVESVKEVGKVESSEEEKIPISKDETKVLETKIDTPVIPPVKVEPKASSVKEDIKSETKPIESNNTNSQFNNEVTVTTDDSTLGTPTDDSNLDTTTEESTATSTPVPTEAAAPTQAPVSVNTVPPAKLSWASKLSSTETTKEAKKILVAKTTAPTTVVTPEQQQQQQQQQHHANQHKSNKKNVNDRKFEMASRKDNTSNKRKKAQNGNNNGANKEGFFPIFINGSYGLNDEVLKATLSKEFGPVMKVNSGENFAVIDFQNHSSQISALEMKKMMIQGYEITIERKTNKKGNNLPNNSNNKTTTTTNDGFISSSKSHRKYQNNTNPSKKRENSNI